MPTIEEEVIIRENNKYFQNVKRQKQLGEHLLKQKN